MFDPQYIKDQADFIAARQRGLGASDMPILAGYTKRYKREVGGRMVPVTPLILWMEKTGRIPGFAGNEATYWGNKLEALVADEFLERKGEKVKSVFKKTRFIHPKYSYALSHPDIVWYDGFQHRLREIKTGGLYAASRGRNPDYGYCDDDRSASGIPAAVYIQVQWQMFTSDIKTAGVSVLINTSDYREYGPICYDKKVIEALLARADRFWWHVEQDREPEPESWGDVKLIFPQVKDKAAVISGEPEEVVRAAKLRKLEIDEQIKKLEKEREDLRNAVGVLIGENRLLSAPDGEKLASQSVFPRGSLSLKELKEKNSWLYARVKKYIKMREERRLYW